MTGLDSRLRGIVLALLAALFLVVAIQAGAAGDWPNLCGRLLVASMFGAAIVAFHGADTHAPWHRRALFLVAALSVTALVVNVALLALH